LSLKIKSKTPEAIANSLKHPEGELNNLVSKVKTLAYLDQKLKQDLPSFLKAHCRLGNFSNGKIILTVDSSAMASKLNFLKLNILEKLRSERDFSGVVAIEIKIDPSQFESSRPTEKPIIPRKFSAQTAEILKQKILETQDKNLREKLEQLLKSGTRGVN